MSTLFVTLSRTSLRSVLLWVYPDPDPRRDVGSEVWGALGVRSWNYDDRGAHLVHSTGGQHQCLVSSGSEGSRRIF